MKITFLGTGAMTPTKERNPFTILITYKNENILLDCAEGTQRQLKKVDISPTKITKILITHQHGDHLFGLHPLLLSLSSAQYSKTLEIYGPKGIKKVIEDLIDFFPKQSITIKYKIIEITKQKFFENQDFYIEALGLNHGVPCLGYSLVQKDKRKINLKYLKKFKLQKHPILKQLQQGKSITWKKNKISAKDATEIIPGKKITIIADTAYCSNAVKLAKNSNLLICESTHSDKLKEKSERYKHMTSKQAAEIAKKSGSEKLILTHFSQRYKTTNVLVKEAKTIFKNTKAAKDFLTVSL